MHQVLNQHTVACMGDYKRGMDLLDSYKPQLQLFVIV
jgi:hypothetical protein